MSEIPSGSWRRKFGANEPSSAVHTFSRPPIIEALSLLPVAYRVGTYISNERSHGREPIFDLNGIALEPPNPGPHAGVPLGGLGGGSIGRGYKGEFRRWSLNPGRYVHRNVLSDVFAIRVKIGNTVHAKVLSVFPPEVHGSSCLSGWDWTLDPSCATYHALFPRSWTVYDDPVPGVKVVVKQVSPFLPHNYSESSLPAGVFEVEVENKLSSQAIEVSIMFVFQNGFDTKEESVGGFAHSSFHLLDESAEFNVQGVCMAHHTVNRQRNNARDTLSSSRLSTTSDKGEGSDEVSVDQGSFAVAVSSLIGTETTVSHCSQFVTSTVPTTFFSSMCASDANNASSRAKTSTSSSSGVPSSQSAAHVTAQATNLWNDFRDKGDIQEDPLHRVSLPGCRVGAAVCIRQTIHSASQGQGHNAHKKEFRFALSWDHPLVRFKGALDNPLKRYYTKFFGTSGLAAPMIACYALKHYRQWEVDIVRWQSDTLSRAAGGASAGDSSGGLTSTKMTTQSTMTTTSSEDRPVSEKEGPAMNNGDSYQHQLFNELYFLVDGGTVWTDSSHGQNNTPIDGTRSSESVAVSPSENKSSFWGRWSLGSGKKASNSSSGNDLSEPLTSCYPSGTLASSFSGMSLSQLEEHLATTLTLAQLQQCASLMTQNNSLVSVCAGDQRVVGQFLYLEGHEYLMYNTYDVHFYASFALLLLFPQLELSLQRDFAHSVALEDLSTRRMMGEGDIRPRKVKGIVPHDLGSPSESPWSAVNAYNFQDVSRWKDLGPKFVLQVYRDYLYVRQQMAGVTDGEAVSRMDSLLSEIFPIVLTVMQATEAFDLDEDGMIENSGFPDQTYDIWTAKGVHAYCGGLWIAACEATAAMARLLHQQVMSSKYTELAKAARKVYVSQLWNGKYLNYDSSESDHHDSIMADMLAGQWYTHACRLPPVVTPQKALSCYSTIYEMNVVRFGEGRWLGAVNGMKPNGKVDSCCLQSREVWTGTTYALAAGMIHEALHSRRSESEEEDVPLSLEERTRLMHMAQNTARGIHDAGWQEFGYWFATPEAWEKNGNYRSLGYMRPLCIWAIQFARESSQKDG